jgi:hypothetical protein
MSRLISAHKWRDGGSLSAVIEEEDFQLKSYWLQVAQYQDNRDMHHEHLYVSEGDVPHQRKCRVDVQSEQEEALLRKLQLTEITHSTDEQQRSFAHLVQVLQSRHRSNVDWCQAPLGADLMLLKRFNGDELYPIARAEWNLYYDHEDRHWNLWISLDTDFAVSQREDTVGLSGQPKWEVNWIEDSLTVENLIPGFKREIPNGYVDLPGITRYTNFYYCSHEDTDDNLIEVLAVEGEKLKIRVEGTTIDVNHYDDSKPRTKIIVETWFSYNPEGRKTIA